MLIDADLVRYNDFSDSRNFIDFDLVDYGLPKPTADWYRGYLNDGLDYLGDEAYEALEAFANGVRYKEWKQILKRRQKKKEMPTTKIYYKDTVFFD